MDNFEKCPHCGKFDERLARRGYCIHCKRDSEEPKIQPATTKSEGAQKAHMPEKRRFGGAFWLITIVLVVGVIGYVAYQVQNSIDNHVGGLPNATVFSPGVNKTEGTKGEPNALDRLQGSWVAQSQVRFGANVSKDRMGQLEFEFTGDQLQMKTSSGVISTDRVTLSPSARPNGIDLKSLSLEATRCGVYEVRGDTLTICYSLRTDGDRPSKLESEEGTLHLLVTLRKK